MRPTVYATDDRLIEGNNPAQGVYICADGDPPGQHWIAYSWTAVIIAEGILVCLSLYKEWENCRSDYRSGALSMLTRDSVLYFLAFVAHGTCRETRTDE